MQLPADSQSPQGGEVITFYSYKGGTGRSMLLANVGWQLASAGKRVLLVDWDLEAPGLHRYFKPFLGEDVELRDQPGVLEWVTDYWEARIDAPDAPVCEIVARDADPRRYVLRLQTQGYIHDGALDLMCAGRQDRHYAQAVADFDWTRLYEKLSGEEFIEAAKELLVGPGGYDYVLIDSRTGVSDTSGFCTVALADTLVVCFTYNNQSLIGASNAARSILQQARALRLRAPLSQVPQRLRRRFKLFAVPSRIDDLDPERLEKREQQAWSLFDDLLTDVAGDQRATYWGAVAIRNHGQFAYEEVLAACMNRPTDTQSMLGSVSNLTRELTGGAFSGPNPLTDEQRRQLRELFSDQVDAAIGGERSWSAWATVTLLLPDAAARDALLESCFPLLIQLFTLAPHPDSLQTESAEQLLRVTLPELQLSAAERQMAESLTATGITERRITQDGLRGVKITDDSVLASWNSLRERLYAQRSFLSARDQVFKARSSWEASGSNIETLRNLASQIAGLEFSDEHGAWLGRPNLQFLRAIREVHASQHREMSLKAEITAAQIALDTARAEWERSREKLAEDGRFRLQELNDLARSREQQLARRSRNVGVVALVMGLVAIGLPSYVQWKNDAVRREIEASRDAAVKAAAEAQASVAQYEKRRNEDAATLFYGLGYREMTRVPAVNRNYRLAISHFSQAIQADPAFAEAFQGRAVARSLTRDSDKPAEIVDWAQFLDLRPSLNRRSKFLSWALLEPEADVELLRRQLAKLLDDSRDVAASDLSANAAASRISVLLDRLPASLRSDAEVTVRALRGGSESLSSAGTSAEPKRASSPSNTSNNGTKKSGDRLERLEMSTPRAPAAVEPAVARGITAKKGSEESILLDVPLPNPDDVAVTRGYKQSFPGPGGSPGEVPRFNVFPQNPR
jgi:MinD-like ATPase involved in chromosome partitioning or flagellar assembly